MDDFHKKLSDALFAREEVDALRNLQSTPEGLVDFSSNDYLGVAKSLYTSEVKVSGGSTGSRLLTGNSAIAERVENELASWLGSEAALVYPSGYMANVGLISVIAGRSDTIIYDQRCHASIRDAIVLSKAKSYSFEHNNADDCDKKLRLAEGSKLLILEGLYSMDGDWGALEAIMELAKHHNAAIIVDEAHSIGVKGGTGEGLVFEMNMQDQVLARTIGFGKAFGYHGGCVAGSKDLIEYLVNYSRSFIYTTGLPNHYFELLGEALHKVQLSVEERASLEALINGFAEAFSESKVRPNNSPIQAIPIGGNKRTREVASLLGDRGYFCKPILSPTVPEGNELIRVILHSYNTLEEIEGLSNTLKEIWPEGYL